MGSPLLCVSQPPPKPFQSIFPAKGPVVNEPVALSNTAKDVFTHWTYLVRPTAPLVSGGAPVTLKVYCRSPRPSKLLLTVIAASGEGAAALWSTASARKGDLILGDQGIRRTSSASLIS